MSILNQFREFLGAGKTSEAVSSELRRSINVQTGLEDALATALQAHRDIIIAGSAGGGKTHLISGLREARAQGLPELVPWTRSTTNTEPLDHDFIRVVTDATPLSQEERVQALTNRPVTCVGVAIAINEGPLLGIARSAPNSPFEKAIRFLHAAQSGIKLEYDSSAPTVFDVGGYNPIENHVVAKLLALPILHELVNLSPCQCEDPRVCPRKLSWQLLQNEEVRNRVNDVLRVVNMLGQPILFRELWDFIADIALRGSCQSNPPTSAWFWRVFFGESELSKRLRSIADPALVVYPRAEAHLWYNDYNSGEIDLLHGLNLVPLPQRQRKPFTPEEYRWLKSQLFFLVQSQSAMQVLKDQIDLQLASALQEERVQEIIAAINAYMSYGTGRPSQQVLWLWTDFSLQRRTDRAHGQVSLGNVSSTDLAIRRSLAVANHPDPNVIIPGARYFLVYKGENAQTGASFHLSPEVLNLLRGGRSYRTSDRPHTDVEWHISRFFSALAAAKATPETLDVMSLNFEEMSGKISSYRLSPQSNQIEPVGGE